LRDVGWDEEQETKWDDEKNEASVNEELLNEQYDIRE